MFTIRHLTNDVATGLEMWVSVGTEVSIETAGVFGYSKQGSGVTNCWQARCLQADGWFSIINGHAEDKKTSD